jgi:transcriptional regulator with XRE-family HTH domain
MTTPAHGDIGAALRILRTQAGLTQDEVSARADIDAAYLSRVEGGWRDIRWSTLKRIVSAIGADLHQLGDALAEVERQTRAPKEG